MTPTERVQLRSFPSAVALAEQVAADVVTWARGRDGNRPGPLVAISGGRIAGTFFAALAGRAEQEWGLLRGCEFFWADERCVPPDDRESNYRLADEGLFQRAGVRSEQIHRIRGELAPEAAAEEAAATLRAVAGVGAEGYPVLDLVLLGMGEDGHVASLFPGESAGAIESPALYRAVSASKPPPRRITLGYGPLWRAREVWVLASGAGKSAALTESLREGGKTPLCRVCQGRGGGTRIYADVPVGDGTGSLEGRSV